MSISSSQTTALPKASMVAVACLIFLSLSPTREPLSAETSSRMRGQFRIEAAALQDRLLPVPGIPTRSNAFGFGRCSFPGSKAFIRFVRYCLKRSSPPTWSIGTGGQNSMRPVRRIICFFCSVMMSGQNCFFTTRLRAKAVSASNSVSPLAASTASLLAYTPTLWPSSSWMARRSWGEGRLKSRRVKYFSISRGRLILGPGMTRQDPWPFQMGRLFWISWMISTEVMKWWKFWLMRMVSPFPASHLRA